MQNPRSHEDEATGFDQFQLSPTTMKALAKKGFKVPTPIQELSIPILMQGGDLVGQAQTGTGKTAAFGLPIIEDTKPVKGIQTLILAPTRELANQIVEEMNWMGAGTPFKAHAIYGGVGFGNQINALRRGDITCLVACPGRLLDLLQRRDVHLGGVRHVVLDEADRMLDMGFIRDIDKIFAFIPRERQTMLFSATMPVEIQRLAQRYLHRPETVRAETGPTATELTDQFQVRIRGDKFAHLLALFEKEKPYMSVVFTKTKHGAKRLAKKMHASGYKVDALQGNLSQNARDRVMADFREGKIDHLVATDVAARGLDISGITHVINFDFPMVNEDYVHRIGRTGRNGKRGRSFLFVESGEEKDAIQVERIAGVRIDAYDVGPLPVIPEAARQHVDKGPPRGSFGRPNGGARHQNAQRAPRSSAGNTGGGGSGYGGPRTPRSSGGGHRGGDSRPGASYRSGGSGGNHRSSGGSGGQRRW
ncbi:MAG TPA: DEAD/DEAH box helicase [Candidatus Thermoplasmatota archaeon]|nr:DEAD/DEAH box helicase [Candidatus Thermoplasmatota archaeon]